MYFSAVLTLVILLQKLKDLISFKFRKRFKVDNQGNYKFEGWHIFYLLQLFLSQLDI